MRGCSIVVLSTCLLLGGMARVSAEQLAPSANHLEAEHSPYLRAHAANPVEWYPWGEAAFARARAENKPIFLSIGYSTCHWCHVMARESFSDPDVARWLNEHFINVKVDREERPDVDRVYQTFVQALTGRGGWPLNVWLTPDRKPFFGGTYFGNISRPGSPAFITVAQRVAGLWQEQPDRITGQAEEMHRVLAQDLTVAGAEEVPIDERRRQALLALQATYDPVHGGFESGEKFPDPSIHDFLLDLAATSRNAEERALARHLSISTLQAMAAGGIYDHVGGGFHRYSVDPAWRVPHFEKMLYDQAQLANVYLTAWQLTADPRFVEVARGVLGYVQERLLDPAGGFYAAEDAESPDPAQPARKREGAYYVWTWAELVRVIGEAELAWAAPLLGLAESGNVLAATAPELAGRNVLYRAQPVSSAETERCTKVLTRLRQAREERPRPLRDETIITAWNGLMISAFARGSQVLDDPELATIARRAADYLRREAIDPQNGRLLRSSRQGRSGGPAFAEDYAFLTQGLIDLYQATLDLQWLEWAEHLQGEQERLFGDPEAGGYYATTAGDDSVVLRLKEANDGPEPAASSVALRNLVRLGLLLHDETLIERARRTVRAFGPALERTPAALPSLLAAAGWLAEPPRHIIVQGEAGAEDTQRLLAEVRRRHLPRHVILLVDRPSRARLDSRIPFVQALPENPTGPALAYVCENYACHLPVADPRQLRALLVTSNATEAAPVVP